MNAKTKEAITNHGKLLLNRFPNAMEPDPFLLMMKINRACSRSGLYSEAKQEVRFLLGRKHLPIRIALFDKEEMIFILKLWDGILINPQFKCGKIINPI